MPENGMKVVITGQIRVYERGGDYQLNVQSVEPSGIGALQVAFEQLKERLAMEGLFDEERKRPLPPFPDTIGIVTAEGGAALRDMISVLKRRMPSVRILVSPAKVQGEGAALEIAEAIEMLNEQGEADLIIVGRGGGSMEDLWAFNEETVAYAIFRSAIPVISAVGHEVDYTIADFTADLRAPTPSAAAELAVRNRDDLILQIKSQIDTVASALYQLVALKKERLERLMKSASLTRPWEMVEPHYQRLDHVMRLFRAHLLACLENGRTRFSNGAVRLQALNPLAVLSRGYSVTLKAGKVVTHIGQCAEGDELQTRLQVGSLVSVVTKIIPES